MGRARGVRTVQTAQSITTTSIDAEESLLLFVPGATAATGVEFGSGRIRLLPEIRYTRWRQTSISGALRLSPDQVEFLLAGVYKIKEINGGNCRQSNDLATSGLYVLTELAQRGIGA
jgi:hypothetical protein